MKRAMATQEANYFIIEYLSENPNAEMKDLYQYLELEGCEIYFPWDNRNNYHFAIWVLKEYNEIKKAVLEALDKESMREWFTEQMSSLVHRYEMEQIDWMFDSLKDHLNKPQ
jgi:hypothetical protein